MMNIPNLGAIRDWCLSKFQQKETGKGLSTNDYTTEEKEKLAALPDIGASSVTGGITTSKPISVMSAEQYILMFNITDWYNSTSGQGVEKKGFIGTVFSNRTFGYTYPDGITKLVISASYENNANAVDGARLTLNIDDDLYMKPMVVKYEPEEAAEAGSYWLALYTKGLARDITFSGIFSGDFDGTVLKKDSGMITEVVTEYTKSNIDCYGGRIANGCEILIPQQKASDDVDQVYGTLPFCGSPNEKTAFDTIHSKRSWIGSILDSNGTWHNLLSIRHRNGGGDGVTYGMYICSVMTSESNLVWRQQINGTWKDAKTIVDESNFETMLNNATQYQAIKNEIAGLRDSLNLTNQSLESVEASLQGVSGEVCENEAKLES